MTRGEWLALAVAVTVLLLVHLPFLPPTFDDIDGINFELGVHGYDPVAHRPHPPGYPVFILLAKLAHPFLASHASAIALLSAVFGALSIVPLYLLARQLIPLHGAGLASLLTLASPLVWFNSARPMSDMTGFFIVITSQCLLVSGVTRIGRGLASGRVFWLVGVVAAGLAIGVRLQALVLVGPVLLVGAIRLQSLRAATTIWLTASLAAWVLPLLYLSGGPEAYMRSFSRLIEDALPAESLLSAPTIHRAAYALWDVLGSPWGPAWLGGPVLFLAAVGGFVTLAGNRRALGWILLLFAPYTVYHYLLQMTETIRYAIPIVPMVALFAAAALTGWRRMPRAIPQTVSVAFCAASAFWTLPALVAYRGAPSPAEQALAYLRAEAASIDAVISGHHVFWRYLPLLQDDFTVLSAGPGRIWPTLTEYWKEGGRKPILFLKDPQRMTLLGMALDAKQPLGSWSWPSAVAPLMKGERSSSVRILRLDPPRWFSDSGLFMTGEAGLPGKVARAPHRAYIRPSPRRRVLLASGTLMQSREAPLALRVGESDGGSWVVSGGGFAIQTMLDPVGASEYVPITFESPAPVLFTDLWIGPADRAAILPTKGFFTPEREKFARLFRWIGPEAQAMVYLPETIARIRLRGRIPIKNYELPLTLSFRWNDGPPVLFAVMSADFEIEYTLPSSKGDDRWGTLTIAASQQFIPDEHLKNGDKRTLVAQIFEMTLVGELGTTSGQPPPRPSPDRD